MLELRTARENARLAIGSQRGRNSHQIDVFGIYDLQGLSYGRTELLVADMRLLAPDPASGTARPACGEVPPPGQRLYIRQRRRHLSTNGEWNRHASPVTQERSGTSGAGLAAVGIHGASG